MSYRCIPCGRRWTILLPDWHTIHRLPMTETPGRSSRRSSIAGVHRASNRWTMCDQRGGTTMRFDLTTPCKDCPFRADITFYLGPNRVRSILHSLFAEDATFACHKTVLHDDDGNHLR